MSLSDVSKETLSIIDAGSYRSPKGSTVEIRGMVDAAVQGTRLYHPHDFDGLTLPAVGDRNRPTRISVTDETTAQAGKRLVQGEGLDRVVALNFASAKNPGGGFLGAAKAQEEDLARASALYPCLLTQPAYYQTNRNCGSMLYTDHIIYSPDVPFFRNDRKALLEEPFALSIITAPAPNAGEALRKGEGEKVQETMMRRAGWVLTVAAHQRHRNLVLGAWGCGVFRNDPGQVAKAFADWLRHDRFRGAFDHIVFAVYERGKEHPNRNAFVAAFG